MAAQKFTCPLCGKISPSAKGAGNHFTRIHGVKSADLGHYFHVPTTCACGKPGKFLSLTRGFDTHCADCETRKRSASAKDMHARLKEDGDAFIQFSNRISAAMKKEWQKDQTVRVKNMCTPKRLDAVRSDDVDAYLKDIGAIPPWSLNDLSLMFGIQ